MRDLTLLFIYGQDGELGIDSRLVEKRDFLLLGMVDENLLKVNGVLVYRLIMHLLVFFIIRCFFILIFNVFVLIVCIDLVFLFPIILFLLFSHFSFFRDDQFILFDELVFRLLLMTTYVLYEEVSPFCFGLSLSHCVV